ncbi:MAG: hypothetical protein Q8M15_16850 [Bacteroidota bacterium]|nr:hypothetical protein [Bacteroidota bacterium]
MKLYIFITIVFMPITQAWAQNDKIIYYKACTEAKNFYAFSGDTVVFNCDSIRLLNAKAYGILEESYSRLYKISNELINKTDSAGLIYKNLYEEKTRDYNILKANFGDFRINTENHILATDSNVLAIKKNAIDAKTQLFKAESSITKGIEDIRAYESGKIWVYLKAGTIGFLAATAIMLPVILTK